MHAAAGWRVVGITQLNVSATTHMLAPPLQLPPSPTSGTSAIDAASGVSLLAAVDFKWLMTGHGWWVDSARFHADPCYAATLLGLAIASPSSALRDCAARLLAQMGLPAGSKPLPDNRFAASGL